MGSKLGGKVGKFGSVAKEMVDMGDRLCCANRLLLSYMRVHWRMCIYVWRGLICECY